MTPPRPRWCRTRVVAAVLLVRSSDVVDAVAVVQCETDAVDVRVDADSDSVVRSTVTLWRQR